MTKVEKCSTDVYKNSPITQIQFVLAKTMIDENRFKTDVSVLMQTASSKHPVAVQLK